MARYGCIPSTSIRTVCFDKPQMVWYARNVRDLFVALRRRRLAGRRSATFLLCATSIPTVDMAHRCSALRVDWIPGDVLVFPLQLQQYH